MKSPAPLLHLKNVWKTYRLGKNVLPVLKNINLDIYPYEFIVIIGPSGSGKSTLMNQLGILDTPSQGKIFFEGEDISTFSESQLARLRGQKIGFVFQQFNLIPTFTALENVLLPTIFQSLPEEIRLQKGRQLLASVGLGERFHHKPGELSGGEQQRVAIARALINDPEIILADEPTGNLDSKSGQQVMDILTKLHSQNKKTIILVTHDFELLKYSQKTIFIKDGEIVKIKENHKLS